MRIDIRTDKETVIRSIDTRGVDCDAELSFIVAAMRAEGWSFLSRATEGNFLILVFDRDVRHSYCFWAEIELRNGEKIKTPHFSNRSNLDDYLDLNGLSLEKKNIRCGKPESKNRFEAIQSMTDSVEKENSVSAVEFGSPLDDAAYQRKALLEARRSFRPVILDSQYTGEHNIYNFRSDVDQLNRSANYQMNQLQWHRIEYETLLGMNGITTNEEVRPSEGVIVEFVNGMDYGIDDGIDGETDYDTDYDTDSDFEFDEDPAWEDIDDI